MRPETQLLPSYSAKSIREQGQSYFLTGGKQLPSVTTILNATKPQAAREALRQWRNRVGAAQAKQIAGIASRRGSLTHQYLKRYLLGETESCPELIKPYWESLEPVLEQIDAVRLVEGFVFDEELGYGGKVDCIASYKQVPCVLDWKTADKPRGSIERLQDGPLQLAAYCGAINACYAQQEIELHHAALITAIAGQPAEVFWFEPEAMLSYEQQWQARVAQFYLYRGSGSSLT
jgi:hypothetical protein